MGMIKPIGPWEVLAKDPRDNSYSLRDIGMVEIANRTGQSVAKPVESMEDFLLHQLMLEMGLPVICCTLWARSNEDMEVGRVYRGKLEGHTPGERGSLPMLHVDKD